MMCRTVLIYINHNGSPKTKRKRPVGLVLGIVSVAQPEVSVKDLCIVVVVVEDDLQTLAVCKARRTIRKSCSPVFS